MVVIDGWETVDSWTSTSAIATLSINLRLGNNNPELGVLVDIPRTVIICVFQFSLPSPPTLGVISVYELQSPPELGDLGGENLNL